MSLAFVTKSYALPVVCSPGLEMAPGDQVRMTLNQAVDPGLPTSIYGVVQTPVIRARVIDPNTGCVVNGYTYTFSYDTDDLNGALTQLTPDSVIAVGCVPATEVLDEKLILLQTQVFPVITGLTDPNEDPVVVAAGLGQQYRQGESTPYVWWKWDGTAWVEDASGEVVPGQGITSQITLPSLGAELFAYEPLIVPEEVILPYIDPGDTGTVASSENSAFVHKLDLPDGYVSQIDVVFAAGAAGNITIFLLSRNDDQTFNVVDSAVVPGLAGGVQNYYSPTDFPRWAVGKGYFVGIYLPVGGPKLAYHLAPTVPNPYWGLVAEFPSGDDLVFTSLVETYALYYQVHVVTVINRKRVTTATTKIDDLPNFPYPRIPDQWFRNGGLSWVQDPSGAWVSDTVGIANALYAPYRGCGFDRVIHRAVVSLAANSTIALCSSPAETPSGQTGGVLSLSSINNTINFHSMYAGGNILPAITASKPLGFTLVADQQYVLELEKGHRSLTARVYDTLSSDFCELSVTDEVDGYTTYPTFEYKYGLFLGGFQFSPLVGVVSVWAYARYAKGSQAPKLYILGDSITQGFNVPIGKRYSDLLRADFGDDEVLVSGIGGTTSESAYARLITELEFMQPELAILFFGTNPELDYSTNITRLVDWLEARGIPVAVCVPFTDATRAAAALALPDSVIKIRTDLALTESGAGTTTKAPLFQGVDQDGTPYNDLIHPNAAGNEVIYQTIKSVIAPIKKWPTRYGGSVPASTEVSQANPIFERTVTPPGTTGAQTINKPSGSVNFAAAATSLVVTNSLVTVNSQIQATLATNDSTAVLGATVAAAGSFTLYMKVAPTAESRVNFLVSN